MSYVCYTRSEGRGLVEVQPTVTLRFDNLHKITANRLIKVLEENYNPYGWSSKVSAVCDSIKHHLPVSGSVYDTDILTLMPHELLDDINAKALLLDHRLKHFNRPVNSYAATRYYMEYNGERTYDDPMRGKQAKQVAAIAMATIAPYRLKAWSPKHLRLRDSLLEAITNRAPVTIEGAQDKRY